MRKAIIAAAAVLGTFASAVPAAAQYYGNQYGQRGGYDRGQGYGQQGSARVRQVAQAVESAIQSGRLDRRQASYFREAVADLDNAQRESRYARTARWDSREFDYRAENILRQLQQQTRAGNRYGGRDYDDDYGSRRGYRR